MTNEATTDALSSVVLSELRELRRVMEERLPTGGRRPDALLDKQGVAEILGISTRKVDRLVASEDLPAGRRVGRCQRWSKEEVLDAFTR